MTLKVTCQPPVDVPQLRYFMRYQLANTRTEYLPHTHDWDQLIRVKSHILDWQAGRRGCLPLNARGHGAASSSAI